MMHTLLLGATVYVVVVSILAQRTMTLRTRSKATKLTVYFVGILVWPMLYKWVACDSHLSIHMIGFWWPLLMLGLEVYMMRYHTLEDQFKSKQGMISMDANILCTMIFALSGILGAHQDAHCHKVFITAVLGTIAFVMPTPSVPVYTLESVLIETMQKVGLFYTTGMLLSGATILLQKRNQVVES